MEIALVGFPQSGKTTIFQALCGKNLPSPAKGRGRFEPGTQIVPVPDKRIDCLSQIYLPQKTIYATVQITDLPGFEKKDLQNDKLVAEVESYIGKVDALVHVVQMYDGQNKAFDAVTEMEVDCIMRDQMKVETRLERIEHSWKKVTGNARKQLEEEKSLLENCLELLNKEKPLRAHDFTPDQEKILNSFQFWSLKPLLILFNCDEEQYAAPLPLKDLDNIISLPNTRYMKLLGLVEKEINELSSEEKTQFLEAYQLDEPGREKVLRTLYELLDLTSFFTVGSDEVRAWTIARDTRAREAAGKIHSDMEKGFIRAEVISYDDLIEYGNEQEVKKNGKCRFEGKEYPVKDGDIISFLFNK